MKDKKLPGAPKKLEQDKILSVQPGLRVLKSDWELMKSLYKGKVNKMFNQWVKEKIKQD